MPQPPGLPGMGGSSLPFAWNQGNYAMDPVSLDRIPLARAVRVGRHVFDAKVLREILKRNTRNPLTREPFPSNVIAMYGIGRPLNSMNWAPSPTSSNLNRRRVSNDMYVPMEWEPTPPASPRRRTRRRASRSPSPRRSRSPRTPRGVRKR
jgi:hypothetical protein